jgi:hypothetical protein
MCAVDTEPRLFDDRERAVMRGLAVRASRRLTLLAEQPRDLERTLHDRAVRPAFGEIRNRLHPVLSNVCAMQGMISDLVSLRKEIQTLTDPDAVADVRTKIDATIAEIVVCLDEMTTDTSVLHRAILAVEGASLVSTVECSIHDIIAQATTLAHHRTKLVAGVTWKGQCRDMLRTPRMVAVNALAAALAGVAESITPDADRGIAATIVGKDNMAIVELRADVPSSIIFTLATQLAVLCGEGSLVGVNGNALQIGFEIVQLS